uniref:CenpcA n=1 Tax=Arundo donax TaxID=35708 RepID=A0A0A9VUX0_ARUDO
MSPCSFITVLACSTSSLDPFSCREMASRSASSAFEGEAAGAGPRVRQRRRVAEETARRGSAASMRRAGAAPLRGPAGGGEAAVRVSVIE